MAQILIPSALRGLTGGASTVAVSAATVGDALAALDRRFPGVAGKLIDRGALRPFIRIFVGGDDIAGRAGLATPIGERDELAIVAAIAGGRDA